jgi:DNA polymerase-1
MPKTPKLVLVDGNALFHRAYHAIPHLSNAEGLPTNAVYGFAMILLKMLSDLKPDYTIVAWDKSSKTFRKDLYPEYKATRVKAPDDLYAQIPMVKELIAALRLPFIELDNYEADDIIGTLSHQAKGLETIIVTGDMDELQLVSDRVKVYTMQRGFTDTTIYDLEKMQDKYGLTPKEFIDLKALKGDNSDNIPGVPGVGEKTAMNLVQKYGSLDGVYEHLDEIPGKLGERLRDNKELAYLSYKLSVIVLDAPIKLELDGAEVGRYDKQAVGELFRRLNFKSLLAKLPPELAEGPASLFDGPAGEPVVRTRDHIEKANYTLVDTKEKLADLVKNLESQKIFALDTETTSVDEMTAELVGLSFSWKSGEAYYVPVAHKAGKQLSWAEVQKALMPVLANEKIGKVGHNIKYDYKVLKRHGVTVAPIAFDTMIAAFIVNPLARSQTLDDLAYAEFGIEMIPITDLIGKNGKDQSTFDHVSIEEAVVYASEDADVTWRLYEKLAPKLTKGGFDKLATTSEWPLIPVLGDMEVAGIELDVPFLKKFNKTISAAILKLEQQIWKAAGMEFNIASPAQLSQVLFDKLDLEKAGVKKGKTGYSTAATELEKLTGAHPIIAMISEFRELTKLKSTYVDALPLMVNNADGRIHTNFNMTIAQTGRLSSTNPNLQNIPVRTELGREIRKAFVAPKGRVLVSADYSQIELRIAAALSKDPTMLGTFAKGIDLHLQTASELFDLPLDKVTKEQRYAAKTINFGVLYGMSAHGLTVATGMSREDSLSFIKRYYELRPGLATYIDSIKQEAREKEYVETLLGRKRPCGEINSNNHIVAAAAERMAVNVPLQGTAADIMKLAMIQLAPKLDDKSQLLLQIHDELIVETDAKQGEKVAELMRETMESVYDLGVPLVVDTAIGTNWGQL